jgi:tRNA guanosine-2'-O-methyltransferase
LINSRHQVFFCNFELCVISFVYPSFKLYNQDVLVNAWDSLKSFSEHGIESEEIRASLTVLSCVGGKIFSRFFFLFFIENYTKATPCQKEMQKAVSNLTCDLLKINASQDFAKSVVAGSVNFGKKIRLWQALCVLSNHLECTDIMEICPLLFEALDVPSPLSIRVHMEIFTSRTLLLAKDAVLPILLSKLKNYDLSAQVVGTYLVCLGHLLDSSSELRDILTMQEIESIVETCTPWFSCAPGLPRSIAQLIARSLVPIYVSFKPNAALYSIYEFIHQNSETVKMLNRQSQFFADYHLLFRCSLRGLIELPSTDSGDRIPVHVFNVLTEFLKNNFEVLQESVTVATASDFREDDNQYESSTVLQKKHIPFSDLQLHSEGVCYRGIDVRSGRQQQDIIVCACLVDKATNLGGIARTCEVFGVRELIVPDIQVTKSEVFQNIAVSSDCWLPISSVEPNNLIEYLEACKLKGYRILGLEQTDSSRNILDYNPDSDICFPSRCVLVLGKEKEGIPVEVLQKVDECIEIPQFGFTRSLNVHVSAALMIWELTKSNIHHRNSKASKI